MSAPDSAITAGSIVGRVLLALRAGRMTCAELYERLGCYPQTNALERMGYVTKIDDELRITDAGRAVCPLRNPLAASQTRPAAGTQSARSSAAIGLPAKTAHPKPLPRAEATETTGGIHMPNPARAHAPTAVDQLRRMLIDAPQGVARKEMIKRTGLAPHAVDNAIINLIKGGEAERKGYGIIAAIPPGINAMAGRLAQPGPTTTDAALAAHPIGQVDLSHCVDASRRLWAAFLAPDEESVSDSAAPEVAFMIHDDGRLTIAAGDEILVIPPDATRRLGYFLGCLEKNVWPPRLDPAANPAQPLAA